MTIDVTVRQNGSVTATTWALNEATVEKAARERMLDLVTEVDGRPLSRWGCDGVVFATPTGSTAYAFSAGGPVVWPDVEALLLVPISAHALFAGPMVVSPESVLAAEVIGATGSQGEMSGAVLWCDGRRTVDLPPGARVEVRRGAQPVFLARLRSGVGQAQSEPGTDVGASFTDRLVAKFGLPVAGWRGRARHGRTLPRGCETRSRLAMLEEVRISGLGVIDEAVLELSARIQRRHRGDRRGQDDGRLRARPAVRRPRRSQPDPAGCRARHASRDGCGPTRTARWPGRSTTRAVTWTTTAATLVLIRSVSAEGRSRAFAGGRSVPVSLLTYLSDDLVAVHGQADQQQLLKPGRQRQALDRFAGTELSRAAWRLPAGLSAAPEGRRGTRRADLAGARARPGGRGPAARAGRDRAARARGRRGYRAARRGRAAVERRHAA